MNESEWNGTQTENAQIDVQIKQSGPLPDGVNGFVSEIIVKGK